MNTDPYTDPYIDPYTETEDSSAAANVDTWRHPVNVGHLVMGIAFLGMVLVWALIVGDVVPNDEMQWLFPLPWVAAGGAGLVAMAVAARRRSRSRS